MSGVIIFILGVVVGGIVGLLGISLMTTSKTASLREHNFIMKTSMRRLEMELKECRKSKKALKKALEEMEKEKETR